MKSIALLSPLAVLVALVSCGGSDDETTTSPKPDAAADASQDAPVADASDAGDVTTEVGADAIDEPEGSSIPAHCAPDTPLPAWAEASRNPMV